MRRDAVTDTASRGPAPPKTRAMRQFIDAVHALSDDPGRANVERYLAASRALEDARQTQQESRRRAA